MISKAELESRVELYDKAISLHSQGLGRVKVADLLGVSEGTVGSWLYRGVNPGRRTSIFPELNPSSSLSYILGVLWGDGWATIYHYRNSYDIGLQTNDREFAEAFVVALKKIGLRPRIYFRKNKQFRVDASSKIFVEWFRTLTLDEIEKLVEGHQADFVRGFYESEGFYNGSQLALYNTDKSKLLSIGRVLSKLGFRFRLRKVRNATEKWKELLAIMILGGKFAHNRFFEIVRPVIKN